MLNPMLPVQSIYGCALSDLERLCDEAGVKKVHADRLRAAVFRRGLTDVAAMGDLPSALRQHLARRMDFSLPQVRASQRSADGTEKMLLAMRDGSEVETVLIPAAGRLTQCISTQVGCAMGCTFCLTATAGLVRHLQAEEMIMQVFVAWRARGQRPRNLVLMGMGEPLHNYEQVARFLRIATDAKGLAFSPNRVTLSTAGLVPAIRRLQQDRLPCNLAVSLNATTDEVRSRIMPINRKYPISMLLDALSDYVSARGGKRVLVEYVMLAGINDSLDDAYRLRDMVGSLDCTVNLLPFNEHAGSAFRRPDEERVSAFRAILVEAGIVAVVRDSRGRDISAACGQLLTQRPVRDRCCTAFQSDGALRCSSRS